MKPTAPLVVLLDKVLSTYVQAFITLLIIHDTIGADVVQSAAIAAIPAALTVVMNALPSVPLGLPFYVDLAYRVLRTYIATFLGLLVAMPVFRLDFTATVAVATAALPAALAVLKGALAARVGNGQTAALVPAKYDVPPAVAVRPAA